MRRAPSLLEGPIGPHLLRLSWPMAIGIVLIIANNLVDTYFVGRLGAAQLAAMSFTFPVVSMVTSIAMGLGIGTTAAVSRAIGQGHREQARGLTTDGCLLAVIVVAALSGVGLITQRPVFELLGAAPEVMEPLLAYMTIWYAGAVFLVVPMVGTGAMRADGDAKTPMLLMGVVALTNFALDPVLIFGLGPIPALGIEGAAIATVVARIVLFVLTIVVLRQRGLLASRPSAELVASWRRILSVGLPAALANALAPIATGIMTGLLANYGTAAVAAYGVASRVEGLLLIPAMALGAAMTPFVGQNWGAHQEARVMQGLRLARRFVLGWGLIAWAVVALAGSSIGAVFSQDPETIQMVQLYLWLVPATYGAAGAVSVITAVFNAVDRAVRSTILSATRSIVLAVPAALFGAQLFGVAGVFGGIAVATGITAVVAYLWSLSLFSPAADLDPVEKAEHLQGATPDTLTLVDELLDRVTLETTVTAAARPINTIGFFTHGYELGHVHRSGKIDLHVPPALHDALVEDALAESHRHHEQGSCWVTHTLQSSHEVGEAVWLLGVLAALRGYCSGAITEQVMQEKLRLDEHASHHHPALDAAVRRAAAAARERWTAAA